MYRIALFIAIFALTLSAVGCAGELDYQPVGSNNESDSTDVPNQNVQPPPKKKQDKKDKKPEPIYRGFGQPCNPVKEIYCYGDDNELCNDYGYCSGRCNGTCGSYAGMPQFPWVKQGVKTGSCLFSASAYSTVCAFICKKVDSNGKTIGKWPCPTGLSCKFRRGPYNTHISQPAKWMWFCMNPSYPAPPPNYNPKL